MNRRDFLKISGPATLFGLPALTPKKLSAANVPAKKSLERIGLQLYTVRDFMKEDFAGTLEKVAAIGYKEVEFAGYFENRPKAVRTLLDGLGLTAPATHVPISELREQLDATIESCNIIGHRYLICPWIAPEERNPDNYKKLADFFNRVGEKCRDAGLQFGYHNHDFEFQANDGPLPYDILLASTEPGLVQMELDLFWIKKAGNDPLAYFEKHKGRFPLCHVKDMTASEEMVAVGEGSIDFAGIFARAEEAGLRHFFVEHDKPTDPLKSIEASFKYLKQLQF